MGINLRSVIKGAVFSLLTTLVLIFILSLLSYFTSISENVITICAYASVIAGILIGSFILSKSVENKKLLNSAVMCAIYCAVLIAASFAFNGGISFNAHTAAIIGGIFASAFLGTLVGSR